VPLSQDEFQEVAQRIAKFAAPPPQLQGDRLDFFRAGFSIGIEALAQFVSLDKGTAQAPAPTGNRREGEAPRAR